MPKPTPQQGQKQLPRDQQDAVDALVSFFKIPKDEALELVQKAQGTTSGDLITNAIRLRAGKAQITAPAPTPPTAAPPEPQGARLVAPIAQAASPPTPPSQWQAAQMASAAPPQRQRISAPSGPMPTPGVQRVRGGGTLFGPGPAPIARGPIAPPAVPPPAQQQTIPGFAPPGGPGAAPSAQQLQASMQPRPAPIAAPAPPPAAMPTGPAPMSPAPSPSMGPMPSPMPRQGVGSPLSPIPRRLSIVGPAPIKPRVRVKAVGRKEEAAPPAEAGRPAEMPAELPLVGNQEEYDKLPIGTRFRHPDGWIYHKESESPTQKMQVGGMVQQIIDPGKLGLQAPADTTQATTQDTDTVPAKLTPGEYVVPKPAVDQIGTKLLDELSGVSGETAPWTPPQLPPSGGGGPPSSGGGKSDVHGAVYEQYGWEGHAANFGPHGNRLGEGYGVGLGVDKQKEVGAKFGDWVRIDFGNGTSMIRQVNETSERPSGVEFFTNNPGTYNNRGKATVTKISGPA